MTDMTEDEIAQMRMKVTKKYLLDYFSSEKKIFSSSDLLTLSDEITLYYSGSPYFERIGTVSVQMVKQAIEECIVQGEGSFLLA